MEGKVHGGLKLEPAVPADYLFFVAVLMFFVIFLHVPEINGWSLYQVLFIVGFMTFSMGLWHVLFQRMTPWSVEQTVWSGDFDRMMLKPMSTITQLLYSGFDLDGFGDLAIGSLLLVYSSSQLAIAWTLPLALLFAVMVASSVVIFTALNTIFASMSFHFTRARAFSNLFFSTTELAKYPLDIFNPLVARALTFFFPIAFISYYPAEIFLGRGMNMGLAYATPLVACVMVFIAHRFWKFGLKKYGSVGH
ncbi:MAG: ABC-2 family transporter protein [Candidatus Aenigmatarchaeota archaeon]